MTNSASKQDCLQSFKVSNLLLLISLVRNIKYIFTETTIRSQIQKVKNAKIRTKMENFSYVDLRRSLMPNNWNSAHLYLHFPEYP